ncbi:DUF3516 domain-containing protein [Actinotignum urinale]|uniref:DEAD/DEAH box helicase n=1 Tax=Actinotignum urinale TaxID=190146 RepID=UPI002A80A9FB|nr:DUF3516 domain-containing protein [Actinotignum urinale]MDY5129085.1 DUF3516 domain-containing protein [Actinotignum urinale]
MNTSAQYPQLNVALDRLEDRFGLQAPEDALYEAFTSWAESTGRPLYPHQDEALLAALDRSHVIVSTPTGSGKSMIALTGIFTALAHGETAYYTAPLKALVSEKFFELIAVFGAENVGMVTGDSSINPQAPVICATAEIVANMALREGKQADIGVLIHDEFHYYADPQRGWAWHVPLLELHDTQHILLSATLGNTDFLEKDLVRRTGRNVVTITDAERPVPLSFHYSYEQLSELIKELTTTHRVPVYIVHFSQREAVSQAQGLLSISLTTPEQKEAIRKAIGDFRFGSGFGKVLSKLLRAGIGVHHAGLLPRYRRLVEKLAQAGLLPVISGTDTLGVGINVPIRTVVMTGLAKFDGTRQRQLTAREFHQVAGRAGRAGFDTQGDVIVQAPEYEIENARLVAKAGDDPVKLRRIQKKKPPENTVLWSEKTFEYIKNAQPETLTPHLHITNSIMLNLLQRENGNIKAIHSLCLDNHLPAQASNPLLRQATTIYMTLLRAGVIRHHSIEWQGEHPERNSVEFTHDVPEDFALNSPLAPFALAAIDLLDPESENYALDVISVIEAVQENPRPILIAQERKARGAAIGRMKAAGIGYEERMAEADKITWPQPLGEELKGALGVYAQTNPWVKDFDLTPKSVVRDMIENARTFTEFISEYDAERSEGIVLRYLTDTYKALRQTVPLEARTPELEEMIQWLGKLVRSVDSSLLDEWEALRDGIITPGEIANLNSGDTVDGYKELAFGANEDGSITLSRNKHALKRAIRNATFRIVEAVAHEDMRYLDTITRPPAYPGAPTWDADAWMDTTDPYFDDYDDINTGTNARSDTFLRIIERPEVADFAELGLPENAWEDLAEKHPRCWLVRQIFDDGQGDNAWGFSVLVDLDETDEAGAPVMDVLHVGEL